MDDLACPKCRSSLYTSSTKGFSCLACGYNEAHERTFATRHSAPIPPSPEWVKNKKQELHKQHELQQELEREQDEFKSNWQSFRCDWKTAFVQETGLPLSLEQRRVLNRGFVFAKELHACYDQRGKSYYLKAAEKLLQIMMNRAEGARKMDLLYALEKQVLGRSKPKSDSLDFLD